MHRDAVRAYWLEVGGLALASVLLFRFGLLGLVFLVPIQLAWIRRGERAGLTASGISLAGIAAFKIVDLARLRAVAGGEVAEGLLLIDPVFALGLLMGLVILNSPRVRVPVTDSSGSWSFSGREFSTAERMLAAAVVGALIYGPTIALVAAGDGGRSVIASQIELLRPIFESAGASTEEIRVLTEVVVGAVLSGLLLGYFVMLVGNWWLGVVVAFRSRLALPDGNEVMARLSGLDLSSFRIPVWCVWPLIVSWAGVLATMVLEMGWVRYLFWNAAFVMLAVYAIQGIAIIRFQLERWKVTRGPRVALAVGMIVVLLIPGLQLIVALGVPGLGVSEIWIDYHRVKGSEETE